MAEPVGMLPLTKRQRYELLRSQLDLDRSSFMSTWRDENDYILPSRGRFQVTDTNRGDRRNLKIIDSSATFAARTLSSGMMSGITSPARPWKRITVPDPDLAELASVKDWLHIVDQRMDQVFLRSNLYNTLPIIYSDMGVFGTSAMIVEEDDEDVIRTAAIPIGRYFLANDHKLRVRTFIRVFPMTVRRIAEKFGVEKLSPASRRLWDGDQREISVEVCQVITPNDDYDPGKLESKFKRFSSCYYERGTASGTGLSTAYDDFLVEEGFDEFPVLAPRWSVTGEDVYATDCPGLTALGDIKALQTMRKRGAQALEKQINPPMTGPSTLRTVKVSILPGEITYDDSTGPNKGFRPAHETNVQMGDLREDQNEIRQLIRRAFYEDLFLMLAYSDGQQGTQPVTAAEIAVRQQEKLLALGPMLEGVNQDLLDPLIYRTFNIMVRKGLIPEPPAELEGMALKVEYISIMAQAQKAVGLAGVERLIGVVGELAKADPSVLDKVDMDQIVDVYAEMTGVPPRVVRDDQAVAQIRGARAKVQAQQHAAEMAAKMAPAVKQLSETKTDQPSALTNLASGVAA